MGIIVGISAHFHDSACCVLRDGELVAAAEEERFSRKKHDASIPKAAFNYCLEQAGAGIADIDCVAYYEIPALKLGRQLWMGLPDLPPRGRRQLFRLDAARPEREIREILGFNGRVEFVEHHDAHAAATYCFSGFEDAAILTVDGVGEVTTTAYGSGAAGNVELFERVPFPHSLGLLYSTITSYLGFGVNDGEFKLMGLASYGNPSYVDQIRSLVHLEPGGQFRLALEYFDFISGDRMYSAKLPELLGHLPRQADSPIDVFAKDLAASMQIVLEEILLNKVNYLHDKVPIDNLCLGGGVALNCTANSTILKEGPFKKLFVCPAAGDAGSALGAAALVLRRTTGERVRPRPLKTTCLGPAYSNEKLVDIFDALPTGVQDFRGRDADLLRDTVDRLVRGDVVGWFQGRMEFGPRALGSRSILADPRRADIHHRINVAVKRRETFRPFAPAALWPSAKEHFGMDHASPFMLETFPVTSSIQLPSVTHVDGSARVQTVDVEDGRFYRLLSLFQSMTGCPILLNTSLNLRGEPIVCTPVDALICFLRSEMDCLVIEDFILDRLTMTSSWYEWFLDIDTWSRSADDHALYSFF